MTEPTGNNQSANALTPLEELRHRVRVALKNDENFKSFRSNVGYFLLQAAQRGNPEKLKIFVEEEYPLDYQDPLTGETVLHILAAGRARKALRAVLKSNKIDYLLRDSKGRLASEMAYIYGRDPVVARLLRIKERKQAEAAGIKLTRRPPPGQ